jgi:hypothetical protein
MKFLLTLLSICSMTVYASDFEYSIAGDFRSNSHTLSIQNDLPSDFLDKEQTIEKEFEVTQLSAKENGKYKVEFYNSTEPAPIKKVVILLYKLNSKTGKFESLSTNFYFFKDTKFWFVGRTFLSPDDSLNIGISNKSLWKTR